VDGAQIADIKTLEMFWISGGKIRNQEELIRAPKLSRLFLYSVEVDLRFLTEMVNLVHFSTENLAEDKLPILAQMKNLKSLSIIGGMVGDLRWLADLTELTNLDLYSVEFAKTADFPQLPSLQKLSVKGGQLELGLASQIRETYPFAKIGK
jgi:hypothetical protein